MRSHEFLMADALEQGTDMLMTQRETGNNVGRAINLDRKALIIEGFRPLQPFAEGCEVSGRVCHSANLFDHDRPGLVSDKGLA